jgi:hypothetical protein
MAGRGACYHSAIPTVLPADWSFERLASTMKHEFHGGSIAPIRSVAWEPLVKLMGDAIAASNPKQSAPLISSLGVEDDYISHKYGDNEDGVEIIDVWVADTMVSATNLWLLHSWDGKLNLTTVYNEAYFTEGQMENVLDRISHFLLTGLEVE